MTAENKVSAAELIGELLCTDRPISDRALIATGADKAMLTSFWSVMKPHLKNMMGFVPANQVSTRSDAKGFLVSKVGETCHVLRVWGGGGIRKEDVFVTREGEFLVIWQEHRKDTSLLKLTRTFDPVEAGQVVRTSWTANSYTAQRFSGFLWLFTYLKRAWRESVDARSDELTKERALLTAATSTLDRVTFDPIYP